MITKVIDQLIKDVLELFNSYDIKLSSRYSPELPGISGYIDNYLSSTMYKSPLSGDSKIYQNKLLYNIGTPKLAEYAPHNQQLKVMAGYDSINQSHTVIAHDNIISSIRNNLSDSGLVKVRDSNIMEFDLEFCVLTESLDLVFAISMIFYNQLYNLDNLTVDLDLFLDSNPSTFNYLMRFDRESLKVGYATFENTKDSLNTISFKLTVSGPIFSNFYTEDTIIDRYDVTINIT